MATGRFLEHRGNKSGSADGSGGHPGNHGRNHGRDYGWLVRNKRPYRLRSPGSTPGLFYREMGAAQYGSIQDSEKARAQVLWALPSRSLGKGVPLANRPLTMRRAAPAGIRTVATPWGRSGLPPGSR